MVPGARVVTGVWVFRAVGWPVVLEWSLAFVWLVGLGCSVVLG